MFYFSRAASCLLPTRVNLRLSLLPPGPRPPRLGIAVLQHGEDEHGEIARVEGEANDAEILEDELDDVEQVAPEASAGDGGGQEELLAEGEAERDGDADEVAGVEEEPGGGEGEVEGGGFGDEAPVGERVGVGGLEDGGAAAAEDGGVAGGGVEGVGVEAGVDVGGVAGGEEAESGEELDF